MYAREPSKFLYHWVKKAIIHQVTTILATFKNVLFPGHNHLLTTSTDDPSCIHWCSGDNQSVQSSAPAVGYDLEK